jgi:hypothetical protein
MEMSPMRNEIRIFAFTAMTLASGTLSAHAEMSFADFTEIKRASAKVGNYIGAIRACDSIGYATSFKKMEADEVRREFLTDLESVGVERSDLSELGDVLFEAETEGFNKYRPALAGAAASQGFEFCGAVYIMGGSVEIAATIPRSNPMEVASAYSNAIGIE